MATKNITKKELALLKDIQKQFGKTGRMWETGYSLPRITEALASVLRNKQVKSIFRIRTSYAAAVRAL